MEEKNVRSTGDAQILGALCFTFTFCTMGFFSKSCKLFLVFIATSLTVWSFALDSPIREILGDTGCWILFFGYVCHVTKKPAC